MKRARVGESHLLRHLAGGIDEIGNPIGNDYFDDTYFHNGEAVPHEGYCTDIWFDEAFDFMEKHLPDLSLSTIHIYFPDPWPKKRHHKRRFFNEANLELLVRLLKPQGILRIATDHGGYFEQMQRVIAGQSERLEEALFPPTAGANTGEWVGTNFERKYLKEERVIYKIAVRKKH